MSHLTPEATADASSPAPAFQAPADAPGRLLDPIDRTSEILFGLIMVLTFTGSLSVAEAGREEVRTMLVGAVGCNVAWGIVDAIMYLMTGLTERRRGDAMLRAVRRASDPAHAHRIIADAMPQTVGSVMRPSELETIRQQLAQLPEPTRPRLRKEDLFGALAVFLWIVVTTCPVVIPFVVVTDAKLALRISNAVAIGMLFLTGYMLGRSAAMPPWRTGLSMVALGVVLVAITTALGG